MKKIIITNILLFNLCFVKAQDKKDYLKFASLGSPSINNSSLASLNSALGLNSAFGDQRADANLSLGIGSSIFSIGISQSFNEKPKKAKLLDLSGLQKGTGLTVSWLYTFETESQPVKDIVAFNKIKKEMGYKTWDDFSEKDKIYSIRNGIVKINPWTLFVKYTANRIDFDYIKDSLAVSPFSENKTNKSLSISFGRFTATGNFLALTYRLQTTYKSGEDTYNYIFPIGNKGVSYAKDITIGTPTRTIDSRFTFDYRKILVRDNKPFFALNPNISYLVNSQKINTELLLYFLPSFEEKDGKKKLLGLQGGLAIGYLSKSGDFLDDFLNFKSDKMYTYLFLGVPFNIFSTLK